MSDTVRVKLENGSQVNLPADHPAVDAKGVEVLHDKPTHYENGDPIPAKLVPAVLAKAAPTIAELRAEIERRNALRDPESQISTSGKKADLVAALEADDAASVPNDGGLSAGSEEE